MNNSLLIIYTIIFLILVIIEYNLLFGFKPKYLILELIGAVLLYFPTLFVFAGIIHPLFNSITKNNSSLQILLDNIPNYLMICLIIKIIKEKYISK